MKRVLLSLATVALLTPSVWADEALFKKNNCMSCHAAERKLVGPSYKAIAEKYAGQKDAADKLALKVIQGGSGVWGVIRMPANTQISEADAKTLVTWILASK